MTKKTGGQPPSTGTKVPFKDNITPGVGGGNGGITTTRKDQVKSTPTTNSGGPRKTGDNK